MRVNVGLREVLDPTYRLRFRDPMKNVQIMDVADNCTFSIYQFTDEEFALVFPVVGQDLEFIDDVLGRQPGMDFVPIWKRPILKRDIVGLHGTLFYEFDRKRRYFPVTKRERDWDALARSEAERKL